MSREERRLAIVGGGWAGLATAVRAVERGWQVSVFEASRHWGGRARALEIPWPVDLPNPEGLPVLRLDNGQHILIGAYTDTRRMMQKVGVPEERALYAMPLSLRFPDGHGLATPPWARRWPAPLDVLAGIVTAAGWTWSERWAFLQATLSWRLRGFECSPDMTVEHLCNSLPERVKLDVIEPLCVAALNTPVGQASAQVFLRVLRDALLGEALPPYRSADLLLPMMDQGSLFPDKAVEWLAETGAELGLGQRILGLRPHTKGWQLLGASDLVYQHVVLACPAAEAARLVRQLELPGDQAQEWLQAAESLQYEPIATTYVLTQHAPSWPDTLPMLALQSGPAQFVFDRSRLGGPSGLLAFVSSACRLDREALQSAVLTQAREQLGLQNAQALLTVVEKRATFACTPDLKRPGHQVATGLWAAGDAIDGPYPATLEGAVRSGLTVADSLPQ